MSSECHVVGLKDWPGTAKSRSLDATPPAELISGMRVQGASMLPRLCSTQLVQVTIASNEGFKDLLLLHNIA